MNQWSRRRYFFSCSCHVMGHASESWLFHEWSSGRNPRSQTLSYYKASVLKCCQMCLAFSLRMCNSFKPQKGSVQIWRPMICYYAIFTIIILTRLLPVENFGLQNLKIRSPSNSSKSPEMSPEVIEAQTSVQNTPRFSPALYRKVVFKGRQRFVFSSLVARAGF